MITHIILFVACGVTWYLCRRDMHKRQEEKRWVSAAVEAIGMMASFVGAMLAIHSILFAR